jgi:hypothetical protein
MVAKLIRRYVVDKVNGRETAWRPWAQWRLRHKMASAFTIVVLVTL